MVRSVVTIDDLSNSEMEGVFQLADKFLADMATPGRPYRVGGKNAVAKDFILATLFFEPSTRTRLSFESAMMRLGGTCISAADSSQTSAAKGETIADMVRVVENYADAIVIRHPLEGAARVAADYASIPVINAGDGSHEHPTQTLCDLYTLRDAQAQKGQPRTLESLRGLNVAIGGDLRHGRTVHSLVYALARLHATIIPRAAAGLGLPDHVKNRLERDYHYVPVAAKPSQSAEVGLPQDVDVAYVTPDEPHQLTLFADVREQSPFKEPATVDVFYSTRLQRERLPSKEAAEYPTVDKKFLKDRQYREAKIMHPLPRVDELSYDIDQDPRSVYFRQASFGVPVRMALLATLLELNPLLQLSAAAERTPHGQYCRKEGIACTNDKCVSNQKSEQRYLTSKFWIAAQHPLTLSCAYCDVEQRPQVVGRLSSKKYSPDLSEWKEIARDDVVFFANEAAATKAGFELRKGKTRSKSAQEPFLSRP